MKRAHKLSILLAILSIYLLPGCGSLSTSPTNSEKPGAITAAPNVLELTAGGFASPEIPRITAEALKIKMDEAYAASKPSAGVGNYRWSDFTLIGVHPKNDVDAYGNNAFHVDQLLGSIIIPYKFYNVANPQALAPKDFEDYKIEQAVIALAVAKIAKNKPVILYDKTNDDGAACAMAKLLIAQGFDPGQITVLWRGFNYWYRDMQYPVLGSDWSPAP